MKRALTSSASANPIVAGKELEEGGEMTWITSPHDRQVVVGVCRSASSEAIDMALDAASAACDDWDRLGGEARAGMLERAADLFEADRAGLMAFLVREAGKTLANAQSDLREAIDHLRYSAAEARRKFAATAPPKRSDRRGERAQPAWARRVCLHLALEFPARDLHRTDRGRARRGQCGGGKARGADAARGCARGQANASGGRPGRCAASPAGTRRDGGCGAGRVISGLPAWPSPAAPTPASPSIARLRHATVRSPS